MLRGIVRALLTKTGGCCNFQNWPTAPDPRLSAL